MSKKFSILNIINIYFVFTIFYYCFGKYKWKIPSYPMLLSYLFICYLALNIGYRICKVKKTRVLFSMTREISTSALEYNKKIRCVFNVSCIFLIVFQLAWVITVFGSINITDIFFNIGENYFERLQFQSDSVVPIMQIRTLLWGITLFAYPLGFMYFSRMPFFDRCLLLFTIIIDIVTSLNMGISKNIGDIVFIFFSILMLKGTMNIRRNAFRKNLIKIALIVLAFLIVFSVIQSARNSAMSSIKENPYGEFASVREDNLFYVILGEDSMVCSLIDSIGSYMSHAYTGLAYALTLPFESTHGIGFSRAIMEYFDQYLNIDVGTLTYNSRIEMIYGWKNGQWWPTAFVWIGNAVSLWGVPIVLLLLGKFIRFIEDDFFKTGNIISLALYAQMIIMLFYLPCNMQIVQSRASLFGTLLLILLFIFRKRIGHILYIGQEDKKQKQLTFDVLRNADK